MPQQPVLFGSAGRAALVYTTYAGLVASLFAILAILALAHSLGDAWLEGATAAVPTALAFGVALVGIAFALLSLGMTALLSRGAKPGQLAHDSWQQAMEVTPAFHRIECVVGFVIAAGALSLL